MHAEIAAITPNLKEVLYHCMEEVRATKAALYLFDAEKSYELICHYGFRDGLKNSFSPDHTIADRLGSRRAPFYINGLAADPRFSELLDQSATDRLLAAPITSRGKLIGFIDMRDKAGRQPFGEADVRAAQKIADQMLAAIGDRDTFGHRLIHLSHLDHAADVSFDTSKAPTAPPSPPETGGKELLEEARLVVTRMRPEAPAVRMTSQQMDDVQPVLHSILLLPGVALVAFSSFSPEGSLQEVAGRATITEDALARFDLKLRAWLRKRGDEEQTAETRITIPEGEVPPPPVTADQVVSILSAAVKVENARGLVLSVAFDAPPERETQSRLAQSLMLVQRVIEQSLAAQKTSSILLRTAEKLLEPDFERFPLLADHSRRVAALAERFARLLNLSWQERETLRLAALLHDVGMRLLDYDKLYRKSALTPDELRHLREHPTVGAALIANSSIGHDVARIVLRHHERPDGTGYPAGVGAEDIPQAAKIIAICEAFDSMTSPHSYQTPIDERAALERIRSMAGKQFDQSLASKFGELFL